MLCMELPFLSIEHSKRLRCNWSLSVLTWNHVSKMLFLRRHMLFGAVPSGLGANSHFLASIHLNTSFCIFSSALVLGDGVTA